jgi:murein L,D-transpeptidase YafK
MRNPLLTKRLIVILIVIVLLNIWANSIYAASGNLRIVIHKAKRQLLLFSGSEVLRTYRIGLGAHPVGPKARAGDRRTPEGDYYVCVKNPKSAYYLSLGISYPGPEDAVSALKKGLIGKRQYGAIISAARNMEIPPWKTALGGEIFIHGRGSESDWTWGCIALDDPDMLELYNAVKVGTPVRIDP